MKIKKNDKAYLQDLKIDIQTKSDISFQELSLLFDKPKFLDMLPNLRKTYSVPNLISVEEYNEYFGDGNVGDGWADKAKVDLSKYTKLKELKKTFPNFLDMLYETEFPIVLEYECYLLCYEFNRPPYFYKAIRQSIFCETVTDEQFKPTEAVVIEPDNMWFGVTLPPVAIFVSPTSTYEDVKEEFRKAKELIKTDKRLCYYQPHSDTVPNIRKYRRWYWEQIQGHTLKEIAKTWEKEHNSEEDEDYTEYTDVLKGIQTYKRLLAS